MKILSLLFAALLCLSLSGCEDQGNKVIEPVTDYELTNDEETVQAEADDMREKYEEDGDR
jgi:hypothetical protein